MAKESKWSFRLEVSSGKDELEGMRYPSGSDCRDALLRTAAAAAAEASRTRSTLRPEGKTSLYKVDRPMDNGDRRLYSVPGGEAPTQSDGVSAATRRTMWQGPRKPQLETAHNRSS